MNNLVYLTLISILITSCRPPQEETDYGELKSEIVEDSAVAEVDQIIEDEEVISEDEEEIITVARLNCEQAANQGRLRTKIETIVFEEQTRGCDFNEIADQESWWEINNSLNGPPKDRRIRASLRQDRDIHLPMGATLCGLDFDFPEQEMTYDDEIFLLLNNYILMMSEDYSTGSNHPGYQSAGLPINQHGLVEFTWIEDLNKIDEDGDLYQLSYNPSNYNVSRYCLGIPRTHQNFENLCKVPETQQTGQMKLDIPSDNFIKIGALTASDDQELQVSFVITGDNDLSKDCKHSKYSFDVEVTYSE